MIARSPAPVSSVSKLPITVVSERALLRDLVVESLRHHGFPKAAGRAKLAGPSPAQRRKVRRIVFVDLANEKDDPRRLLRALRAHATGTTTVAIGTPLQLAAQAQEADGWLLVSEPATRLSQLAAQVEEAGDLGADARASHAVERWSRTWRRLTRRQRQVLALLGCGLDNHKLAGALGISERAVKAHVSALLEMFKADSRTELALIATHANLGPSGARWHA
jgi:DNA-binding NarL/FixJ family response regulator